MTHANDSRPPRRTRRQFTAATLVLLASIGWARLASAGEPILSLAIDPDTPATVYAGAYCSGVLKSLDRGATWSNTGLTNIGSRILVLAIDPTMSTTVYAAAEGDVFKSLNGGSSWQATGLMNTGTVSALVIDPVTTTTVYAAGSGVFLSLNGGDSWSPINTGLMNTEVWALAINPGAPATLYAGTGGGVFKSLNGGGSWQATGLRETSVLNLAIDPITPTTLYAGTGYLSNTAGGGVFKSLNGGDSWSAVNTGLPNLANILALAIDPTMPTSLYASARGIVFRSLNGGGSWSEVSTGLANTVVWALAIDPEAPATLWAGAVGVFKSLNAGSSWEPTGLGTCGDGVVMCGEQCDDRGESTTCDADCTFPECGDGVLNVSAGEQCDDGNRNPADGCTNACTVCGDGVVAAPEECDEGNTGGIESCDAQCRLPHVVGTGTPQSCTEAEFEAALAERSVRFDCGPDPVTIALTSQKAITADTTIDGGGLITLSGGGAVRIFTVDAGASLDVRNLTLADAAGAIYNSGAASLTNCTLRDNSADRGGAIYNAGTVTLTNCTLSGNSAVTGGGGIYIEGGSAATLTNCTLSDNSATAVPDHWSGGGGIYNFPGSPSGYTGPGNLTLRNTIIANSPLGGDCKGGDASGDHNLIEDAAKSCYLANGVNGNIVGVDPHLGPLANNGGPTETHALCSGAGTPQSECLAASPAIDAGDPEVCANPPVNGVDQRGYVRPGVGHTQCSIGAYEADAIPLPPCTGDCNDDDKVAINELILGVNIALGRQQTAKCPAFDRNARDGVEINELITAVSNALNGCGGNPPRSEACKQQDQVVQAAVDDTRHSPNAIVAVKNEACGVSLYASGNPAEATTASLFLLASVTKTFVATSVLSLVKEGKLGLDDPINTWIVGLDAQYDLVTVRMLLKHTSGIFNYTDDPILYANKKRIWVPRELVDLALTYNPYFAPGEGFHYSNTNYILLGIILEEVTGEKLATVLHQYAIDRGGLQHTFFPPEDPIEGQMATPFYPSGQKVTDPFDPSVYWAVGGVVASARDVVGWVWALYASQTVLDPTQVREMLDDSTAFEGLLADAAESRYGLGAITATFRDTNSGPGVGHSGRWDGASVDAYYFKDTRTAVAVLQNVMFWPPKVGDEAVLIGILNALSP